MAVSVPNTVLTGTDVISGNYTSDVVSSFDIHKPEHLNVLFEKFGGQGGGMTFFMLLKSLGRSRQVSADEYIRHNKGWSHETVKIASAVVSPGAGATGTYRLDPDSLDSNNSFYPRLYDTVLFANGVTGTIIAIAGAGTANVDLSIAPNDVTKAIPDVAIDDEFAIVSSAFAEGTGQPAGAVTKTDTYVNHTQIIKETMVASGTEMTNQTWTKIKNMEGAPLYNDGLLDAEYRLALKISGALLFQEKTTNTNVIDAGNSKQIHTTEGLLPYMRNNSPQLSVAQGSFTMDHFDVIDRIQDRAFAGKYVMSLLGIARHHEIENTLKDYFDNTEINYAREVVNDQIFGGNKSLAMSVNFKILTKGERTYCFKRFGALNHPKFGGVQGANPTNQNVSLGLFIPMQKQKDAKTGGMRDSVGYVYKGYGNYSRLTEMWSNGSAGPGPKTNDIDNREWYWRSNVGGDWGQAEQMLLLTV